MCTMQITRGLLQKYGANRVRDTPITEASGQQRMLDLWGEVDKLDLGHPLLMWSRLFSQPGGRQLI